MVHGGHVCRKSIVNKLDFILPFAFVGGLSQAHVNHKLYFITGPQVDTLIVLISFKQSVMLCAHLSARVTLTVSFEADHLTAVNMKKTQCDISTIHSPLSSVMSIAISSAGLKKYVSWSTYFSFRSIKLCN